MRDTLRVTAEPVADDRAFRCSVGAADEPMAGSAAVATSYLLVEHAGPWGRKALAESRLPEHVRHGLAEAADQVGVRVQLIRRPGRPGASTSFRVFATYADPVGPWTATALLAAVVLWGVFGSIPERIPGQGQLQGGGGTQQIPSPGEGLLTTITVVENGKVTEGQLIATISGVGLQQSTQAAEARYQEAERQALLANEEKKAKEEKKKDKKKKPEKHEEEPDALPPSLDDGRIHLVQEPVASRIARQLQQLTGIEARVTSLGHVQRGGEPTALDRLLATRLGTKAGQLLAEGTYDVMVAIQGDRTLPVPLEEVAGQKKLVPLDHPWIDTARLVETCLGDYV